MEFIIPLIFSSSDAVKALEISHSNCAAVMCHAFGSPCRNCMLNLPHVATIMKSDVSMDGSSERGGGTLEQRVYCAGRRTIIKLEFGGILILCTVLTFLG
jgi:hypothetical protein